MSSLRVRQLDSLDALKNEAVAWNDLWQRSAAARPTAQAEQLVNWHECFADEVSFRALVVESDGLPVAALPVAIRRRWPFTTASSLGNAWTPGGELLLDPTFDAARAMTSLVTELTRCSQFAALDGLMLESNACQALFATYKQLAVPHLTRRRFTAPLIRIRGSWNSYLSSRSANLRRQLKMIRRRAESIGGVELRCFEPLKSVEVERLVQICFEIEAKGWKGRQGTAVQHNSSALRFFVRQAHALGRARQLAIALLYCQGRPIAFEYGWHAKGVRGILKIGYDESFAKVSPGLLLRMLLLEELFNEGEIHWVDFVGPIGRATGQWATHHYEVGRDLAAVAGLTSRILLKAYQRARGIRVRSRSSGEYKPQSEITQLPSTMPFETPESASPQAAISDLDNYTRQF